MFAFAIAMVQRPGFATSDTKIDLHVSPVRFLSDVASTWTPTGSLGHVQGGQYAGYLFPMGPFFAVGHLVGIPDWVVGRLWLGTLIALASWGVVRLMDALYRPGRGVPHLVAGAMIALNPYVVVFANQTSVTLVGYAALPWLLLAAHRGLRDPRGWWWPAAVALILMSTEGGVNAAVTAWLLPAVGLLLLWEAWTRAVTWRAVGDFVLRAAPLSLVASLWWVAPALVQSRYGIDFLQFTEHQGAIWTTTSLSEAIRLMGYWITYLGVGFAGRVQPYFSDAGTLLFDPAVVTATLLVPALALAGFVWSRRWRYGPFFLALVLMGLIVMTVGFPEGTPLRRTSNFVYNHIAAIRFLRTTYKAGPLVALGLACLGGAAAGEAWRRIGARRTLGVAAATAAAALLALSAWPLVQGRAVERRLAWKRIPHAWTAAAHGLDRTLPRGSRALVLPGQLFAFYTWGGTVDPILPALTRRPVGVRNVPPFADQRATDLLWSTDSLLQEKRLVPGQLLPLVRLMGARAVITGADDDRFRSGAMAAADAAGELRSQAGFSRPSVSYGPFRRYDVSPASLGPPVRLPEVRRYDVAGPGLVRVQPAAPLTVVDGSADALGDLAGFGALPARTPLVYAGDQTAGAIRAAASRGADLVVSDSNRRRTLLPSQSLANTGPTLGASDPISSDASVLDPFKSAGTAAQTVAEYDGARYVRAPASPNFAQLPEHRPFAAFDGSTATSWLADPHLDKSDSWIEIGFTAPRDLDRIELMPHDDSRASTTAVSIAGRRFDVHPGRNTLRLSLRHVDRLRILIVGKRVPATPPRGAGGLDEVRIPGLAVHERLRPPALIENALRGADLRRSSLTYLFDRTTADDPYRVGSMHHDAQLRLVRDRSDPEAAIARTFVLPAPRRLRADAWLSVDPATGDGVLDRLAGYRGAVRFTSSSRFAGVPGYRASAAFDGNALRGWIGSWIAGRPAWLAWTAPAPAAVNRLQLLHVASAVRFPTRVRLTSDEGSTPPLAVGPRGAVVLPRPLRGRRFRLDVLAAAFPPGTSADGRGRSAMGIAEVRGPGVPTVHVSTRGRAGLRCGDARLRLGGHPVPLLPRASIADIDAGRPFRATQCGAAVALPAGATRLDVSRGMLRVDHLRLASPAPAALREAGGGQVVTPGSIRRGSMTGTRLSVRGPSWLVLGESYNRGWRAFCGGRALGAPVPIDGYANGWRVGTGCRTARFEFAPNRIAYWGYALSAVACALLLVYLLVARRRRLAAAAESGDGAFASSIQAADRPPSMPLRRALLLALPAALAVAFVFAARTGPIAWLLLTLVLWRGIGARALIVAAAGLLLVVVPALYLIFPGTDLGGFDTSYAQEHLGANWVAVAAYVLLATALCRVVAAISRATRPSGTPPTAPAE